MAALVRADAFAHQACRQGLSALYLRAPRLFEELGLCHADGSFRKRLAALDRLLHNAHRIHLEGKESMRKQAASDHQQSASKSKKN
jgi:hypothetical protein